MIPTTRRYEAADSAAEADMQDRRMRIKSKGKSKAGKLAVFMNIPLDIIFEVSHPSTLHLNQTFLYHTGKFDLAGIPYQILGHLRPLDLLHLSRTTKEFRSLLMDKKTTSHIWRAARIKFAPELPDCPPSMSEPKYANLVWDQHCHVCLFLSFLFSIRPLYHSYLHARENRSA